jgi:hypothetical protein
VAFVNPELAVRHKSEYFEQVAPDQSIDGVYPPQHVTAIGWVILSLLLLLILVVIAASIFTFVRNPVD